MNSRTDNQYQIKIRSSVTIEDVLNNNVPDDFTITKEQEAEVVLTPDWTNNNLKESNSSQLWKGLGLWHAIKALHEKGELPEELKVKSTSVEFSDTEEDEENAEVRSVSRNYYKQFPPSLLTEKSDDGDLYLHSIEMELVKPVSNPRYNLYHPESDSHCFGLLTSSPLPLMGPLEIHSASGLVLAYVRSKWQPVSLSREELSLGQVFHDYIFRNCLKITKLLHQEKSSLPLVVPLDLKGLIDWKMCELVEENLKSRSEDPAIHLEYNLSNISKSFHYLRTFQDLVLYSQTKDPLRYFIEEISEMTASTVMDGLGCSMAEHARVYVGLTVEDKDQPLIRISSACKELYMFSSGGEPVADGKKRSYRSYKSKF